MKAVAVCPEGKELRRFVPGRASRTVYLIPFTMMVRAALAVRVAANRSRKGCFDFIPVNPKKTLATAGTYCT
mgnify:CR=1 FL=1